MENLTFGLTVTLIGMLIVFAGLMLLIILIKGVALATGGMGKKAKKETKAPAPAATAVTAQAPVDDELMAVIAAAIAAQDEELVAVISAAIAATMEAEGTQFRVRRIRRINNAPAWAKAGRDEQIFSRY